MQQQALLLLLPADSELEAKPQQSDGGRDLDSRCGPSPSTTEGWNWAGAGIEHAF